MGEATGNAPGGPGKGKVPMLYRTCPECDSKVPGNKLCCPECGTNIKSARWKGEADREAERAGFGPERAALKMGVLGGIVLILAAAVWFYIGWQAGYVFYYPPILALIGLYGIVKGLGGGNVAGGERAGRPQRRRR